MSKPDQQASPDQEDSLDVLDLRVSVMALLSWASPFVAYCLGTQTLVCLHVLHCYSHCYSKLLLDKIEIIKPRV